MLYLITGAPGAGKTNYLIGEIRKYQKEGRPLFQHGIKGLKLASTQIYCSNTDCRVCVDKPENALMVENWNTWVQPHYVIIVDEVQQVWRPRGSKSLDIPISLRMLETHRHEGIDFWFMTQHPSFLDVHARRLVTKHVHIKVTWAGRLIYNQPEVNIDTNKPSVKGVFHKLDRKAFKEYTSSRVHTKVKMRIPAAGWFYIVFFFVGLPGIAWYLYSSITGFSDDFGLDNSPVNTDDFSNNSIFLDPVSGQEFTIISNVSPVENVVVDNSIPVIDLFNFTPLIPDIPATAPAFIDLVQIQSFPRVAGCVQNHEKSTCNCYSQQGSKLDISLNSCIAFVENTHFDYFRKSDSGSSSNVRSEFIRP